MEIDQNFVTIKVWRRTRRLAKYLALERGISFANLLDDLVLAAANGNAELGKDDKEYVYFIQSSNGGSIKIGKSIKPSVRLKQLCEMYKDKSLSIIGIIEGNLDVECELHNKFSSLQEEREWFRPDASLLEYIKNNTLNIEQVLSSTNKR